MSLAIQNPPSKEHHYLDVQEDEDGKRFVLCKNCRKRIFIGSHTPRLLGELCSSQCVLENAEFYK